MKVDSVYKNYLNTIKMVGVFLLEESDERIREVIFEDYPIDVQNLSEHVLKLLMDEGYIDQRIAENSRRIRECFNEIESDGNIYTIDGFKHCSKWRGLLELSDETRELLYM